MVFRQIDSPAPRLTRLDRSEAVGSADATGTPHKLPGKSVHRSKQLSAGIINCNCESIAGVIRTWNLDSVRTRVLDGDFNLQPGERGRRRIEHADGEEK